MRTKSRNNRYEISESPLERKIRVEGKKLNRILIAEKQSTIAESDN